MIYTETDNADLVVMDSDLLDEYIFNIDEIINIQNFLFRKKYKLYKA